MTNPAAFIAFGVVLAAAALFAFFTNTPQATKHGRERPGSSGGFWPPSPSPSPPPSSIRRRERRRRSPERRSNSPARVSTPANEQHERIHESPEIRSNSPAHVSTSANEQCVICRHRGETPYIKISPCNHASLCKSHFETHLENNDTCPDCHGRIDSCSPPIPPFGKCRMCRRFTKLFKFLNCNHSLSLCIGCFQERNESYRVCPECGKQIRGSEPRYTTSGICGACDKFTPFAIFQPCGHGNFCRRHASDYLASCGQECSECGGRVTHVE